MRRERGRREKESEGGERKRERQRERERERDREREGGERKREREERERERDRERDRTPASGGSTRSWVSNRAHWQVRSLCVTGLWKKGQTIRQEHTHTHTHTHTGSRQAEGVMMQQARGDSTLFPTVFSCFNNTKVRLLLLKCTTERLLTYSQAGVWNMLGLCIIQQSSPALNIFPKWHNLK